MRRKYGILILFLAIFGILLNNTGRVLAAGNSLDLSYVKDESEYQKVINDIGNGQFINDYDGNIDPGNKDCYGVKIYNLTTPCFAYNYLSGEGFNSLGADDYKWLLYDAQKREMSVIKKGDKWTLIGISTLSGLTKETGYIDLSIIDNINNNPELIGVEKLTDVTVKCYDAPFYNLKFIYLKTIYDEYIVPFSSRPDFTGLVNGEIYKLNDAAEILNVNFPVNEGLMENDGNGGGHLSLDENYTRTSNINEQNNSTNKMRYILLGLLLLCAGTGLAGWLMNVFSTPFCKKGLKKTGAECREHRDLSAESKM